MALIPIDQFKKGGQQSGNPKPISQPESFGRLKPIDVIIPPIQKPQPQQQEDPAELERKKAQQELEKIQQLPVDQQVDFFKNVHAQEIIRQQQAQKDQPLWQRFVNYLEDDDPVTKIAAETVTQYPGESDEVYKKRRLDFLNERQKRLDEANAKMQRWGGLGSLDYKIITESLPLGVGAIVKESRQDPELFSRVQPSDVAKGTANVLSSFVITPVLNFAGKPLKVNIPGIGEITNREFNAQSRIQAGENPWQVGFEEGLGSVLDTTFILGFAAKLISPRPTVVATGVADLTKPGVTTEGISQLPSYPKPKSFRVWTQPESTMPVPKAALDAAAEQGFPFNSKFNPDLPTFFKMTGQANGKVTGQIIQMRPPIFEFGKTTTTPATPEATFDATPGAKNAAPESIAQKSTDTVLYSKDVTPKDVQQMLPTIVSTVKQTAEISNIAQNDPKAAKKIATIPDPPAKIESIADITTTDPLTAENLPTTTVSQIDKRWGGITNDLANNVIIPIENQVMNLTIKLQSISKQKGVEADGQKLLLQNKIDELNAQKQKALDIASDDQKQFQIQVVEQAIKKAQASGLNLGAFVESGGDMEKTASWSPEWQDFSNKVIQRITDPKTKKQFGGWPIQDVIESVINEYKKTSAPVKNERSFNIAKKMQGKSSDEIIKEYNKDLEGYRSTGISYEGDKQPLNANLMRVSEFVDLKEVQDHVKNQVNKAIESGEISKNADGSITVYRAGKIPKDGRLTSVTYSEQYAKEFASKNNLPISKFDIAPEKVKSFIGKGESELLVSADDLKAEPKREKPVVKEKIEVDAESRLQYELITELQLAEPGERITKKSEGEVLGIIGKKSTFPDWIPDGLRKSSVVKPVVEHILNDTMPTKADEVRLYNVIAERLAAREVATELKDEINVDELFNNLEQTNEKIQSPSREKEANTQGKNQEGGNQKEKEVKKTPSGLADSGGYADVGGYSEASNPKYSIENVKTIALPELVDIARELSTVPNVRKMRGFKLGHMVPAKDGLIELNKDIFKDPVLAAKVLAHEIGHLFDFLPDKRIDRGNLLGRIATLTKYRRTFLPEKPGAAGELTTKDRARLRREAQKLAEVPVEEEMVKVVSEKEPTTEELLEVFRGTTAGINDEALSDYIKQLTSRQKVEIAKQAMKGQIPKWVDFKRKVTEKITMKVIKNAPEDIRKIYKQLLTDEIKKRKLFSEEEIRNELTKLTHKWKPFNPNLSSPAYVRYRMSSVELYADAMSVLLNDPAMLKNEAPTFYQAFFSYLDSKPEVSDAYFELQKILNDGPEAVTARRREGVRKSFLRADYKAIELENIRQQQIKDGKKSWWSHFKRELISNNQPFIDKVTKLEKEGKRINDDENPIYYLRERRYLGGKIKNHIEKNIVPIMDTLKEHGMSEVDLGEILFYERITKGDRGQVANPRGLAPEFVQEVFGENIEAPSDTKQFEENSKTLKADLGEEKFAILQQAANDFRAALKDVFRQGYKEGLYNDELMKIAEENDYYVPFKPQKYMDQKTRFSVKGKRGTLQDIENPVNTAIEKQIAIIRAIERNKVNRVTTNFLKQDFSGEIEASKTRFVNNHHEIVDTRDPNKGTIIVMEKGKPVGYDVDKYIADSINNSSIEVNHAIVKTLSWLNAKWFRPVFTSFNVGFQLGFNPIRDFKRYWRNMPEMTMKKAIVSYAKAAPHAFRKGFDKPDAIVQEMYGNQVLSVSFNDVLQGATEDDTQLDLILERANVFERSTMKPGILKKGVRVILGGIENLGNTMEALPKIAGYMEIKRGNEGNPLTMSQKDFVRRYIGSPDFLEKGKWTPATNNVFLFSNAIAQGLSADLEILSSPKTRSGAWWRMVKWSLLPKIIMAAGAAGYFGKWVKDNYDNQTEYDKTNYITIPMGFDQNGKGVYFRLPDDETARFLGAIFWKGVHAGTNKQSFAQDFADIVSLFGGQLPTVSPSISVPIDIFKFATGQNVYDSFRQRNVLSDTEMKASFDKKLPTILTYLFNEVGGSVFVKLYNGEPALPNTNLDKVLKIPILSNLLGRFIRVTDQGKTEKLNAELNQTVQQQADKQLENRELIDNAINQGRKNRNDSEKLKSIENDLINNITKGIEDPTERKRLETNTRKKFEVGMIRGTSGKELDALIDANTNQEKAVLMKAYQSTMSKDEYESIKKSAIDNKIITDDVLKKADSIPKDAALNDPFFLGSYGPATDSALRSKKVDQAIEKLFPSVFGNSEKFNALLSESKIDRAARDYTFGIYPFTDEAKKFLKDKTFINSSGDSKPYGGQYLNTTGSSPFEQGEIDVVGNSGLDTVAHESLHALIMESGKTNDPKWVAAFNAAWEKAKKMDSELQAIDEGPLKNADLYGGIEDNGSQLANERFAYLGGSQGQAGLTALPKPMQPFYAGILKPIHTDEEISQMKALFDKQDQVANEAADGKISEDSANAIFSTIDDELKKKYGISRPQSFEEYLSQLK